ncbi:plastocyanin/azurin family copper-binding protein [Cerasicoccus maritimus]|uniref:plastocyanin/azurin family copper-binding protein n=1 Tax=Cerasicoccus maritimus TaxID=490089 RepID=UPI0028525FAD|nr:plastocyanin/azurin family copper-binding protein [Cerasicoccus maritimus]
MRITISICLLALATMFAACGPQPLKPEEPEQPAAAPKVSNASGKTATSFTIDANDQMRFSTKLIEVPAGKKVSLTLRNVGHMPKEQMGHNLVILDKGKDVQQFAMEATFAKDNDYIPTDMENWVIAGTQLLGPGESETIIFTAPKTPGEYPFLCSFPAHCAIGMKGIMRVVVEVDK